MMGHWEFFILASAIYSARAMDGSGARWWSITYLALGLAFGVHEGFL